MSFIYRNWTVHNLVGHPLSEVSYLVSVPFVGKSKAEDISGWIHDATLPLKNTTQGRGQMRFTAAGVICFVLGDVVGIHGVAGIGQNILNKVLSLF